MEEIWKVREVERGLSLSLDSHLAVHTDHLSIEEEGLASEKSSSETVMKFVCKEKG